jgi:fructose 1,6-bisphosphatase
MAIVPMTLLPITTTNIPVFVAVASITVLSFLWTVLLRPRRGGKDAPPLVVSGKSNIPFIGVLLEFFSSPNKMVQRCLNDYGPVFTIPVRMEILWNSAVLLLG